MLKRYLIAVLTAVLVFVVITACSQQKESKIKLPVTVEKAVQKIVPKGEIAGFKKENEQGKEFFNVMVKSGKKTYELDVTVDGKILDKEEVTAEKSEETQEEEESETLFNFDSVATGNLPEGWINQKTGKGGLGIWSVIKDSTAPSKPSVLAQTSKKGFGYHFSIAFAEEPVFSDLEINVKFKAVDGQEDQGGGPVWRYQDEDNYYICRANPLESNFRVYKVVNGNRRQLQSASLTIPSKVWHAIKIENTGNRIKCWLNGKLYLDVYDETFKSGKVGLWTKADAVTYFDDFEIQEERH